VVAPGQKLLTAALEAGIDWPHDCRVGSCGTCRCYLRQGKIKPLRDFIYTLEADDIHDGAILACQTLLKSDVTVEIDLGTRSEDAVSIVHGAGRVIARDYLTHDIQSITIDVGEPLFFKARAGQYVELSVEGIDAPRSYSFARAPRLERPGEISFFIRHVPGGEFTDWLFREDRTGAEVEVSGPYGNFHQRDGRGAMICVAGGSGLAPIKALIEDGVANGLQRDLAVYFGARTRRDLYCIEELERLGERWRGNFVLFPVLSDEPPDSDWPGARGLVTAALEALRESGTDLRAAEAYLCGPPPMVDAAIATLSGAGVPDAQIFYDKFEDASTRAREPAGTRTDARADGA